MSILVKIKNQFAKQDIYRQKAEKMAQTQQFLHVHRQAYRSEAPLGFKTRSESSYHLARASR
jgi:hypothetical protein